MSDCQASLLAALASPAVTVRGERLGPLPLLTHILERLGLPALLARFVTAPPRRGTVPPAHALGVLLRSFIVEREPIYRQQETVATFSPAAFGLAPADVGRLGDDQLGRTLDRLFDADRGTLLTEIVVAACRQFGVVCTELHNDSTTIRFTGQYRQARGRTLRGKRAPFITYGRPSKDHRPDLKQLLWILTTSADGGIPVQFRCADGNTDDATTHQATWDTLCQLAGRRDFLYIGDSKLCNREVLDYINRRQGRFIAVLPRTRREDPEFRKWLQTNEPTWEEVRNRPHPRRKRGPRDIWRVCCDPLPSLEGWRVIWVWTSLGALQQEHARRERIARATQDLQAFQQKLRGPRPRRDRAQVEREVHALLVRLTVDRYLQVRVVEEADHRYRQEHRGRPGPETRYRRVTHPRLRLDWATDASAIAYDQKSDGMYPLLTNARDLTPREVLEGHKRQPQIEKRFAELKSVYEIAPVFLKNEGRIEAFFFLYFVALLVQALIEREVRRAMRREGIRDLPLYPEARCSRRPTAEQILRLFSLIERHALLVGEQVARIIEPELTDLQKQVLRLLEVPEAVYRSQNSGQ